MSEQTQEGQQTPSRPALRYHGGKWRLAPWIIAHFPAHRVYVEPFGGGASVLIQKTPVPSEVYNDLDGRIVEMFRVLRDPRLGPELLRRVALTPYAREEHVLSYNPTDDPVESARRTIVRGMMGHGSRGATSAHRTGFRTARRRGIHAAGDWANYGDALPAVAARFRGVLIEHRDACAVMREYDDVESLHYVDPPYPAITRTTPLTGSGRVYAHELTDDDHRRLAGCLHAVRGSVVLSGYACDLYDRELYADWDRREKRTLADGRVPRTEVLWLNPACSAALAREQAQHEIAI